MSIAQHAPIQFSLVGQDIRTDAAELMVDRTKGVYLVEFDPDETWAAYDGKMKAVFRPAFGQKVEADVVDFQAEIPQDAIRAPWVQIGVYAQDGNVVYPTVFSSRIAVNDGTYII
ncbi:MAG: hypothetical protein IKG39_08855 [Lachnospiraceae bacterium]|nr:hypothetical protein [Lachnospiraceae bacterium]